MFVYIYSSKTSKLAHHGTTQQASQQDTILNPSQEKITLTCMLFFFYLSHTLQFM